MIYENINGINKVINKVKISGGGVERVINNKYENINGIYRKVYEIKNNFEFKKVASLSFRVSSTKSLNLSTSISFASLTLDGIDDLISKYYIYSVGGALFYSNNTFAGSVCLYYSGDNDINFISNTGKCTLANTNGNINVQYGGMFGYGVFDNTLKNLKINDLKKINRVRLYANGSWHNAYTYITDFSIDLYDLVEVEKCN